MPHHKIQRCYVRNIIHNLLHYVFFFLGIVVNYDLIVITSLKNIPLNRCISICIKISLSFD